MHPREAAGREVDCCLGQAVGAADGSNPQAAAGKGWQELCPVAAVVEATRGTDAAGPRGNEDSNTTCAELAKQGADGAGEARWDGLDWVLLVRPDKLVPTERVETNLLVLSVAQ